MSLEKYRSSRLVVQSPRTSVHDAARAMEANHVGAILVQDRGELVGIVTDRDLAVRVVGHGLDPEATMLEEVMSSDVASLPLSAEDASAVDLMRVRHIRRVPLLDDGDRLAGLVSLDDVVLDAIDPDGARDVILTQLEEPASRKPAGYIRPEKRERKNPRHREAKAEETLTRLLHRVQVETGLESRELAETALDVVLSGIVRRITYQEAADLIAQLPSMLQEGLLDLPRGPDRSVTLDAIEQALVQRLDISPDDAFRIACGVGAALEQAVSDGEMNDVRRQLPGDIRRLLERA